MSELWFRIRDFFRYNNLEKRDLFLTILLVTFIFAFDDKRDVFNIAYWVGNFLLVFIFVALTLIVHTGAQKILALKMGYFSEYKAWPLGLAIGVILSLITGGKWILLLFGGFNLVHVPILRIGKWRYGLQVVQRGQIAIIGSVANLVFATFALVIGAQLGILPTIFTKIAQINFWILIYALLPFPKLSGVHIFFMSRLTYVWIFTSLLAYVVLALLGFYSWVIAFFIGIACWLTYLIMYEM